MPRRPDPFEPLPRPKSKRVPPFAFVLDELSELPIETRAMFGCTAIYVRERIVLVLREKARTDPDNGVWVAYLPEHESSVLRDFPALMPIRIFGERSKGWRKLSSISPNFESDVLEVCERIRQRDPRFGKIPERRKRPTSANAHLNVQARTNSSSSSSSKNKPSAAQLRSRARATKRKRSATR